PFYRVDPNRYTFTHNVMAPAGRALLFGGRRLRAMVQAGRVEAIWIKRVRGGPMNPVDRATMEAGRGIVGSANQGGRRQVTIIERESWERLMAELGASLDPSVRRANLMVSGISLRESRGKHLVIGPCRIELHGETRPCRHLDELL